MAVERVAVQLRLRPVLKRAVDELVTITGSSREEIIHALLQDGLPVMYERLGIEPGPEVTAGEMLSAIADSSEDTLSDSELAAIETTCKALDRIAQVRAREQS